MAEYDISILLRAKDLASRTIGNVDRKLGRLGSIGSKAAHNLTTNLTRVGMAAGVGLVGALGAGIRSLADLERVTNQTNAVIESTGGVAGVTAAEVRNLAQDLENLTTADDKAIQSGQNLLLTFTGIGKETFPRASKAMADMAIAMAGGDVEAANFEATAIQLGKALNDPIRGLTALRRVGVSFTKDQEEQIKTLTKAGKVQQAQALILAELEREFGKAGEAAGKGFGGSLRRLQDVGEDLTQALARGVLPALTRFANWLQNKLADPKVQAAIERLGVSIGKAVDSALAFIDKVDFTAAAKGLSVAKDAAATIVKTFLALPPWVQQAIVTGWGLNKLTGGAVGDLVGELGKGLIKGVLGMTAGVVNLKAGVVNGAGMPLGGAARGGGGVTPVPPVAPKVGPIAGAATVVAKIAGPVAVSILGAEVLAEVTRDEGMKTRVAQASGTAYTNANLSRGFLTLDESGNAVARAVAAGAQSTRTGLSQVNAMVQRTKDDTVAAQNRTKMAVDADRRESAAIRAATGRVQAAVGGATRAINAKRWQITVNNTIPVRVNLSGRDLFSQTQKQGARQTIR